MNRPTLFIGSSSEGVEFARAVQAELQDVAESDIWYQGIFGLNESGLGALLDACKRYDFAVLVATADDVEFARNVESQTPRDNVVFELGLFYGALGRDRTFMFMDSAGRPKLPSDLAGITWEGFDGTRSAGRPQAAVGPACHRVREQIRKLGSRRLTQVDASTSECSISVVEGDIAACDKKERTLLLPSNEYFDTTEEGRIVETKSSLGAVLAGRGKQDLLDDLNLSLTRELDESDLESMPGCIDGKPGRQRAYPPGACVRVPGKPTDIILGVVSSIEKRGTLFYATPFNQPFDLILGKLWQSVAKVRVRGELVVPVIGSGFLGMKKEVVLAKLLNSFYRAQVVFGRTICNHLTVVVYYADWEDGQWVERVASAVDLLRAMDVTGVLDARDSTSEVTLPRRAEAASNLLVRKIHARIEPRSGRGYRTIAVINEGTVDVLEIKAESEEFKKDISWARKDCCIPRLAPGQKDYFMVGLNQGNSSGPVRIFGKSADGEDVETEIIVSPLG